MEKTVFRNCNQCEKRLWVRVGTGTGKGTGPGKGRDRDVHGPRWVGGQLCMSILLRHNVWLVKSRDDQLGIQQKFWIKNVIGLACVCSIS